MLMNSPGATTSFAAFAAESATPRMDTPVGAARGCRKTKPVPIFALNAACGGPITVRLPSGFTARS